MLDSLLSGNFTAVDVETTGLYPELGARVIEVGVARVRNFEIVDTYSSLINPDVKIPSKIVRLNGITNEMIDLCPRFSEVASFLFSFIGGDVLVAHNASFDRKFLFKEFKDAGRVIYNRFVCTFLLSKYCALEVANFKLVTLIKYFKINFEDTLHRALSDAIGAAQIFINLIKMMGSQNLLRRSLI